MGYAAMAAWTEARAVAGEVEKRRSAWVNKAVERAKGYWWGGGALRVALRVAIVEVREGRVGS